MKKFFVMAFAAVALLFVSCSKENSDAAVDQLKAAIEQQDPAVLQDALNTVAAKVQELVAQNPEQAKALFTKVQELLKENADKVSALVGDNEALKVGLASFTEVDADKAIELVSTLNAGKEAVEDGVDKAKEAVEDAKEAIEKAPEAVKEAADKAVEDAKAKATEKVNTEVQNAKDKANEKIDNAVSDAKKKLGL